MKNIINSIVGMNPGTRARTIAAVVTAVLDFLTVFGIVSFSDPQVAAIQKIVLVIVTAVVWGVGHWKNNDYTEEACQGTGMTRLLKMQGKDNGEAWTENEELEETQWEE